MRISKILVRTVAFVIIFALLITTQMSHASKVTHGPLKVAQSYKILQSVEKQIDEPNVDSSPDPLPASEIVPEVVEGLIDPPLLSAPEPSDGPRLERSTSVQKVTTIGKGEVSLSPNIVYVTVSVVSNDENAKAAQNKTNEDIDKIIASLLKYGILSEDVKTVYFSIYPAYAFTLNSKNFSGYDAAHTIKFKLADLSKLNEVLSELTEAGVTRIDNVEFTINNKEEAYKTALLNALSNAKQKAATILNVSEENLALLKIREHVSYSTFTNFRSITNEANNLFTGEILIFATVEAIFEG